MVKVLRLSIALVLLLTLGCASRLSPIQQVQITHDALATAQDLEVQLCLGVANVKAAAALPVVNKCSTSVAPQIGLTDARHQALQRQFAIAIGLHKSITQQFAAGASSVDLSSLRAVITALLAELAELSPTPQVVLLQNQVKAGQIR